MSISYLSRLIGLVDPIIAIQVQENKNQLSQTNISKFVKQGLCVIPRHKSYVKKVHKFYNDDANSTYYKC